MSSSYLWKEVESEVNDLEKIISDLAKEGAAVEEALKSFNDLLAQHTFLVHDRLTFADELVYRSLHPHVTKWNTKTQQQYLNIVRWFDLVQNVSSKKLAAVALATTLSDTAELKAGPSGASSRIPGFPAFSSTPPSSSSSS